MNTNNNVKEMSVEQLKALAYDLLVALENVQNNLKVVNNEISSRQTTGTPLPPEAPKEEEPNPREEDTK